MTQSKTPFAQRDGRASAPPTTRPTALFGVLAVGAVIGVLFGTLRWWLEESPAPPDFGRFTCHEAESAADRRAREEGQALLERMHRLGLPQGLSQADPLARIRDSASAPCTEPIRSGAGIHCRGAGLRTVDGVDFYENCDLGLVRIGLVESPQLGELNNRSLFFVVKAISVRSDRRLGTHIPRLIFWTVGTAPTFEAIEVAVGEVDSLRSFLTHAARLYSTPMFEDCRLDGRSIVCPSTVASRIDDERTFEGVGSRTVPRGLPGVANPLFVGGRLYPYDIAYRVVGERLRSQGARVSGSIVSDADAIPARPAGGFRRRQDLQFVLKTFLLRWGFSLLMLGAMFGTVWQRRRKAKATLREYDAGERCIGCDGVDVVIEGDRVRCAACGHEASLSDIRRAKVSDAEIERLQTDDRDL